MKGSEGTGARKHSVGSREYTGKIRRGACSELRGGLESSIWRMLSLWDLECPGFVYYKCGEMSHMSRDCRREENIQGSGDRMGI